jgi:ABC-2 type transport system ATP-binding protein
MDAVVVENLVKHYGDVVALDGASFSVAGGEVFGLLGPNGAGKTTTIKILTGLTRPTSGRALVAGFDVVKEAREVKRRIGWISSEIKVDDELPPWRTWRSKPVHGASNWRERVLQLLRYFGLLGRRWPSYIGPDTFHGRARRWVVAAGVDFVGLFTAFAVNTSDFHAPASSATS